MLYSEFIAGTGCKQNEHNFKVYQHLEIMYMNSDLSKAEIYEYGKKLVDNSKSESELAFEQQMKNSIEEAKAMVEYYKGQIATAEQMLTFSFDPDFWKRQIRESNQMLKLYRNRIRTYKELLV